MSQNPMKCRINPIFCIGAVRVIAAQSKTRILNHALPLSASWVKDWLVEVDPPSYKTRHGTFESVLVPPTLVVPLGWKVRR